MDKTSSVDISASKTNADLTDSASKDSSGTSFLAKGNLGKLFFDKVETERYQPFARVRDPQTNAWVSHSWMQAAQQVARLAVYLREELGVKKGDRVAILSATRYEWLIADLAILSVGAVSTPVYHTLTSTEVGYLLWDCEATVVFAENEEQLNKLVILDAGPVQIPETENYPGGRTQLRISKVICFEDISQDSWGNRLIFFHDIASAFPFERSLISDMLENVGCDDLASLVYTSGSTGPLKGVIQSHRNHLAMLDGVIASKLMGTGKGIFLFLPLAHSFARLIAYTTIAVGGELIFAKVADAKVSRFDAKQMLQDVRDSNPSIFPTVPRVLEKIMNNILSGKQGVHRSAIIRWAVEACREGCEQGGKSGAVCPQDTQKSMIIQSQLFFARTILKRIRKRIFGRNLSYVVCGGAPVSLEVLRFFDSLGILVLQGYGLTETTPAISANTITCNKFGSVGRIFEGMEIKISPSDGEILVRGGNIALGYWNKPVSTKEVWLKDGWFQTGDLGVLDDDGYLTITGRKKEIIVLSSGKKITPTLLEGRLKSCPYISHVLVYGDNQSYLVALVTLDFSNLAPYAQEHGFPVAQEIEQLVNNPRLNDFLWREIHLLTKDFASHEQIRKMKILAEDFTIENGLLTPTLKLKRKAIVQRYWDEIEELYLPQS